MAKTPGRRPDGNTWESLVPKLVARYRDLQAGTKIDSKGTLAEWHKGDPRTLNETINHLIWHGFLSYRSGRGVVRGEADYTEDAVADMVQDRLEFRLLMEPICAGLAAHAYGSGKPKPSAAAALDAAYNELFDAYINKHRRETQIATDFAFHGAIRALVPNHTLRTSMQKIADDLSSNVRDVVGALYNVPEYRTETFDQHTAIYKAISNHDSIELAATAEKAEAAMRAHLDYAHGLILRFLRQGTR